MELNNNQMPWVIRQLTELAERDPDRFDAVVASLWAAHPELRDELAIRAATVSELSVTDAAAVMGVTDEEVHRRIERAVLNWQNVDDAIVVGEAKNSVARLSGTQIAVWEVIREYRRLGSVEALTQSFPVVSKALLAAAFRYAAAHPDEIEKQIEAYEEYLQKRREQYPFATTPR